MDTKLEKRNRLIEVFAQFSEDDQEIIIRALKKQLLLTEAARLSATILPNNISEEEILDEVKKVRKEMYTSLRRVLCIRRQRLIGLLNFESLVNLSNLTVRHA